MDKEKNIEKNLNQNNSNEYFYYLSPSHSMNIIDVLSIAQNEKNLEPQDNLKKLKQRQLLKNDNKIKNIKNKINEEEKFIKINSDDYLNNDIKSFTAVKRNKTNRIFSVLENNKNNKDDVYKLNFLGKANDDNNVIFNNKNNNFVYTKKNINNYKKLKIENLTQSKYDEEENNEKVPMDNIKKRKTEKKIVENPPKVETKENEGEKLEEQIINEDKIKNDVKKEDTINIKENNEISVNNNLNKNDKNENDDNMIINEDNIVFKDIKDLKHKYDENILFCNNKIEYIDDLKREEENFDKNKDKDKDNNDINQEKEKKNEIININNIIEEKINLQNQEEKITQSEEEININLIIEDNQIQEKEEIETKTENTNKETNITNITENKNQINEQIIEKSLSGNFSENNNDDKLISDNIDNLEIVKEIENENDKGNNYININTNIEINEKREKDDNKKKIIKEENDSDNKIKIEKKLIKLDKKEDINIISKNEQILKEKSPKKNVITKISVINFDTENNNEHIINKDKEEDNKRTLDRYFSSKIMTTYGQEVRNISKLKEKEQKSKNNKNKNNKDYLNKNKKGNKLKLIYKSPKNITSHKSNNNPINKINNNINSVGKNKHKLINRIRAINISSKSLIFTNNFINKKNNNLNLNLNFITNENNLTKKYNKLNSFSPGNKSAISENKKNTNILNRKYSENNLTQIRPKFFEKEEKDIENDLNEFNENEEIYYYEPQSIVNYSSSNFINKKKIKKNLSLSVQKEKKNNLESRFNSLLNSTINTINKNLFKFIDFNFSSKKEEKKVENKIEKKEIDINEIREKIKIKNKNIEKIKKLIEKTQKEIIKCDKEIKSIDSMIQKEEINNNYLIHLLNYFNSNDI